MHAHDAHLGRCLTTETGNPIPREVLAFLLSGRRAAAHFYTDKQGNAEREQANMGTTRIETELIVTPGDEAEPPSVNLTVVAEHEQSSDERAQTIAEAVADRIDEAERDPIEGTLADWQAHAQHVGGELARRLAVSMGFATAPVTQQHRTGILDIVLGGDASGLIRGLAEARAAVERAAKRHTAGDKLDEPRKQYIAGEPCPNCGQPLDTPAHWCTATDSEHPVAERDEDRVLRSDERAPDEYVQHDTARPVEDSAAEHPRYRDADLESIAVEVGCAMFGEAYRDWLDSGDQYAVAMRERGAGALHATSYVDHMRRQS